MKHLDKTMTEYVFQEGIPSNTDSQFADKVMAYANFLSETLNPSMFMPSVFEDGKWVILEEPNKNNTKYQTDFCEEDYFDSIGYECDSNKYRFALENVYFEGFELIENNNIICKTGHITEFKILDGIFIYDNYNEKHLKTIEDLIPYKLKLTPTIQNRLK